MENFMHGRLTTLNYLKARRDDYSRHPFNRMRADRAIRQIVASLRDRQMMKLRERLINATRWGDLHAVWMIENEIRAYEKRFNEVDAKEYTERDEDGL